MWSSVTIPRSPEILMLDTTANAEGWEQEFFSRLFAGLSRSGLKMAGNSPYPESNLQEFGDRLSQDFNCLILFVPAQALSEQKELQNVIRSTAEKKPFLLALCSDEKFDPAISTALLSTPPIAPIVITPTTPAAPRQSGLFYLKFFTELKLHCTDAITGKMAWFSFSKARELLRRRRYGAQFGIRC